MTSLLNESRRRRGRDVDIPWRPAYASQVLAAQKAVEDEKQQGLENLIAKLQAIYRGKIARANAGNVGKKKKGKGGKKKK